MTILSPTVATGDQPEREPTAAELAAIDAEWPAIAADLAELGAFIAALLGHPVTAPNDLDRRRARRTVRRALVHVATDLRAVA